MESKIVCQQKKKATSSRFLWWECESTDVIVSQRSGLLQPTISRKRFCNPPTILTYTQVPSSFRWMKRRKNEKNRDWSAKQVQYHETHCQYDETHKEDEKRVLTELGREQADLAGTRIAEMMQTLQTHPCKVKLLVVSNMTRAKETANNIQEWEVSLVNDTCHFRMLLNARFN